MASTATRTGKPEATGKAAAARGVICVQQFMGHDCGICTEATLTVESGEEGCSSSAIPSQWCFGAASAEPECTRWQSIGCVESTPAAPTGDAIEDSTATSAKMEQTRRILNPEYNR